MADTTLNLTELISPSDDFSSSASPVRYIESLVDSLALSDTITDLHTIRTLNLLEDSIGLVDALVERNTERFSKNLIDGLAVGDIFGYVEQNIFTFDFEDNILLSDDLGKGHTIRKILSLGDALIVTDEITIAVTDRFDIDIADSLSLIDTFNVRGTDRFGNSPVDAIVLLDTFLQEYGILMEENQGGEGFVNGLSFGSFLEGTQVDLTVNIPFNNIFFKWLFPKSGIDNIYKASTTLIVPVGGGVVKPSFIDLGSLEIPVGSIVTFVSPNVLEYIEDADGDYISTTEVVEAVGDAVSVASKNLTIEQGSTFSKIIIYRDANSDPVDLTGYTAKMQIRKTKDSSTILLTLNTSNGYLVLGGVAGTITINVPASISDALDFVWGRYDLELYPGGDTTQAVRLLEGKINLSKQVTQ